MEAASGTRILIDPGVLSTLPEGEIAKGITAVLITHNHQDHLDNERLLSVFVHNPEAVFYGPSDCVAQMKQQNLPAHDHEYSSFVIGDVTVEVVRAAHDPVLGTVGENAAYRIDGELVVTGDSTDASLDAWKGTRLVALPTIAPWGTRPQLAKLIDRLQPSVVFPVHDGFVLDGFLAWQNASYAQYAESLGVRFVILKEATIDL